MNNISGKLGNSSKVAIIGGGPAGALFALYLLHFARKENISPDITIFEQRNFNEPGEKGCKGCAGILSMSFYQNLSELGLALPESIIQSKIDTYAVHSPYTSISISIPEKGMQTVSVYRGGGPRLSNFEERVSFNDWLLREARSQGARLEEKTVSGIHLEPEATIDVASQQLKYDLIVLASGVNSKPLPISGLRYIPPRLETMSQAELYAGRKQVESCLGNMAHVFLFPNSDIIFGSLVPKGTFINVSLLSHGEKPLSVKKFLDYDLVRSILPEHYEYSCNCNPKAAVSMADNFYADRFISIGDAAISRLYKDGIGSSLLTAREAARTAVYRGISRQDFKRHYYPLCYSLNQGNSWGRLLFSLNERIKNSYTVLITLNRLLGNEQSNIKGPRPFTKAAWGMFSGSYSYKSIAWMTLNPASLARFLMFFTLERMGTLFHGETKRPRKLHVGTRKILILGSGFGGTYVFRHLLPSLNRNENIETTMVSEENFFLFAPLLHEVAMGKIETRHIAFPIRRLNWKDRFNFMQDKVQKIDLDARRVFTTSGIFEYDYLVLALGSITDISQLKHRTDNTFTLKTLHDSILIRNHLVGIFEQAIAETDLERRKHLLTFVVCGAGYTGVQVVTELRDFIFGHLIKTYRSIDPGNIRIILIEAESGLLAGMPEKLGDYALKQLQKMNIEIRLNSRVTDVQDFSIQVNNTEHIANHTLIWVAGIVANPRIAELDVEKDSLGRISVNQFLEVSERPGVYALGDCAHFTNPASGHPIPPRAHTTVRQARVAAHNILAEIRGWDKRQYHYSNDAEMASLGASKAVMRFHGILICGFLARLIWIAGYTFLVTGNYNRIRILTDWALSRLFGRDTTYLKLFK